MWRYVFCCFYRKNPYAPIENDVDFNKVFQ